MHANQQATIRIAQERDIPKIARIGQANFPSSNITERGMLERLSRSHVVFVAEIEGEMAGFIDLRLLGAVAKVAGIATVSRHRRMGVGTALLAHAISFAKRRGMLRVELRVSARNLRAISVYKKAGFLVQSRKVVAPGAAVCRMVHSFET